MKRMVFVISSCAIAYSLLAIAPVASAGSNLTGSVEPRRTDTGEITCYLPLVMLTFPPIIGDLRSEWDLMVDDENLAYHNVPRVYHQFQKYPGNPILTADQPWEEKVVQLYGTVLPGFRMWYSTYSHTESKAHVLYAESTDGLSWRKPNLDGANRNVLFGGEKAVLPSVIHLPQDRKQPYRLLVFQYGVFNGYRSANGISTSAFQENPLWSNNSDISLFYWDPIQKRFRGTTKQRVEVNGIPRRSVRFIDSDDLITWESQPDVLTPDEQDDALNPGFYTHFYGMPVFQIGKQYLGLLWMLNATDQNGEIGRTYVQLVSSHDGAHWLREEGDRPTILDHGTPGEWDDGQVYTSSRPVKVGDELWLYYSGCDQPHGVNLASTVCSIGLAKVKYNRLVSLSGTGTILTRPAPPTGRLLHLNYDASQGQVTVQLLADGKPIPGYEAENCLPMTLDSQDQVVSWLNGGLLPDTPFQIEFRLVNSSIFAFALLDQ